MMTTRVGTPAYMAPELASANDDYGPGKDASTMVDVYSFGILLWALATTQEPYSGGNMNPFQLMAKVVDGYRPKMDEFFMQRVGQVLGQS